MTALRGPEVLFVLPAGESNALRVRVQAGHVESWLNGEIVVDAQRGCADWNARVATSMFAPFPHFGRVVDGHIALQDYGDPAWFRQIRIRRL